MKFSLIIPTQDRPELLAVAVAHAMRLDHADFEIIVSDNSTSDALHGRNAEVVHASGTTPRLRIVRPSHVLSLPEHFEFALNFATGDYIGYLTDKMVVLPSALADVEDCVRACGAEIVNWAYAQYTIDDLDNPAGSGLLAVEREFVGARPSAFDPIAALRFKASGVVPRNLQRVRDYALGKIVFGVFARSLIERIRAMSGTVFCGATHDYSAMVQGLSLAKGCVMLNKYEVLFIALPPDRSLGSLTAAEPKRALRYFQSFSNPDSILAGLLVPGLYASQHNMVAHDYKKFLALYGNETFFDEVNWLAAIHADLCDAGKLWADDVEKAEQLALFQAYITARRMRLSLKAKKLSERATSRCKALWMPISKRIAAGVRVPPRDPEVHLLRTTLLEEAIRRVRGA